MLEKCGKAPPIILMRASVRLTQPAASKAADGNHAYRPPKVAEL